VSAGNFNILLIDDSEAEAKLFELALRQVAPRVKLYWVATAKEGLEYLHQEGRFKGVGPVSIVVCDLNMPETNGFEFVSQMKKDPALFPIPLVVYSGSQLQQDIYRAYSLGVNSYLAKPMTMDSMIRQIEILVRYWLDTVKLANGWHPD
jgi:two-component system response regulator